MRNRFLANSTSCALPLLGATGCPDPNEFEYGIWAMRISTEVADFGIQFNSDGTANAAHFANDGDYELPEGDWSFSVSDGILRIVRETDQNTFVYQGPLLEPWAADGTYYVEVLPYVIGEWSAVHLHYLNESRDSRRRPAAARFCATPPQFPRGFGGSA